MSAIKTFRSALAVAAAVVLILVVVLPDSVFVKTTLAIGVLLTYGWLNKLTLRLANRTNRQSIRISTDSDSFDAETERLLIAAGDALRSRWMSLTIAAIDVETTGLSPKSDRVIEVAVVIARGGNILHQTSLLVNPQMSIPREATRVHGITDEAVTKAPTFSEIASQVAPLLDGVDVCIAYNAAFDRGFLLAEFERLGTDVPAAVREFWPDPLPLARRVFAGEVSHKLADTARRLGITQTTEHRAASDAEAALHIWYALVNRAEAALIPELPTHLANRLQEQAVEQDVIPIVSMVADTLSSETEVPFVRVLKSGSRKVLIGKVPGLEDAHEDCAARRRCFRRLAKERSIHV